MIMGILRKVLSYRKNLFAGSLVLFVSIVFGLGGVVYAKMLEIDESEKFVVMKRGVNREVKLQEGDGIRSVVVDVRCGLGEKAYQQHKGGQWVLWGAVGEGERGQVGGFDVEEEGFEPGKTKKYRFKCSKTKPKPE